MAISEFVQGRLTTVRLQDKIAQFTYSITYCIVNNRSRINTLKYGLIVWLNHFIWY